MAAMIRPERLVILDIDGLRRDVLAVELERGLPALGTVLAGGAHLAAVSAAPSITFCCQASLFTGAAPGRHGIAGNQFFDRLGRSNRGLPRFYAFDVGDSLAVEDAVRVFTGPVGLLGEVIAADTPTLYEMAARRGLTSAVMYHMLARGANHWEKPDLVDIARFTKGGGLLGLTAEAYDGEMLQKTLAYLRQSAGQGRCPDILTLYFMGLDHHSHQHGPRAQADYLRRVVDAQVARLLEELQAQNILAGTLFAVVSDHGQIEVHHDDRHSLRMSFPFERELATLFDALGLDVNDKPGEGAQGDAVIASNGGLAHIYLRRRPGEWSAPPRFAEDVLPVARAFWRAHRTGETCPDLLGGLALVLARDVEQAGWQAPYQAVTPEGIMLPLEAYLADHPDVQTLDAVNRLDALAGPNCGDLLLASNYADGFYFGAPLSGTHGGLHPEDSGSVLSFGWPSASGAQVEWLRTTVAAAAAERCRAENGRLPGVMDLVPIVNVVMDWNEIES